MSKTIIAGLALLAVAPAYAGPVTTFERDGEKFVYTTEMRGDRAIITGRRYPSGSAFRLVVRGDSVRGFSGGFPVRMTIADAHAKVAASGLAAR